MRSFIIFTAALMLLILFIGILPSGGITDNTDPAVSTDSVSTESDDYTVKFNLDGCDYFVSNGTTWAKWCDGTFEDSYNDYIYKVSGIYVYCSPNGTYVYDSLGNKVLASSEIIPGNYGFSDHDHIYVSNGDATCTKDGTKTCNYCTSTITDVGSSTGHKWTTPADCSTLPKCTVCGKEGDGGVSGPHVGDLNGDTYCEGCLMSIYDDDTISHTHKYTTTKSATCSSTGRKECDCGNVVTISKTSHAYVSNGDATCTKDGTKTCNYCTSTITDVGSSTGHKWTTPADCSTLPKCIVCSKEGGGGTTGPHVGDLDGDGYCEGCMSRLND